jgi:hydrogenase maturation factor
MPRTRRSILPAGKLPANLLARLLRRYARSAPGLLQGPGTGEDAAVLTSRRGWIAFKADPITFAGADLGAYAVDVNANDLATRGARPRWFLMTLLLPEGRTRAADVERVFADVDRACRRLGVVLCGGHTEITAGLTRPILAGAMLGTPQVRRPLRTADARVGDRLLLSKGIAVEGTSVLAGACHGRLQRRCGASLLRRASRLLRSPGISVLRDARLALRAGGVSAMHDPTEGGLATALHELADAARVGLEIERDRIPVLPETRAFCGALGLDPLGLLASGALLVAASPRRAAAILTRWRRAGIVGACIGSVVPRARRRRLRTAGRLRPLPRFERDEVARLLGRC